MDRRIFDDIIEKQDKLADDMVDVKVLLAEHKVILSENTRILDEHQKRTRVSEDRLEKMENLFHGHLQFLKGAFWVLSGLTTIAGLIAAYIKFFS